jgi:DNA (cytosine-5)-methyltransferase 1
MKRRTITPRYLFPEMSLSRDNPWLTSPFVLPKIGAKKSGLSTFELCAGGGGQALGFEQAGIEHLGLVEIDKHACATLRTNREHWQVLEHDLRTLDGSAFKGVDILSGGLPCPPFSIAGKQLGQKDDRNLFPALIRLVDQIRPRTVTVESVRGSSRAASRTYSEQIAKWGLVFFDDVPVV